MARWRTNNWGLTGWRRFLDRVNRRFLDRIDRINKMLCLPRPIHWLPPVVFGQDIQDKQDG